MKQKRSKKKLIQNNDNNEATLFSCSQNIPHSIVMLSMDSQYQLIIVVNYCIFIIFQFADGAEMRASDRACYMNIVTGML